MAQQESNQSSAKSAGDQQKAEAEQAPPSNTPDAEEQPPSASVDDVDDDEDETCGFCKFMKAGGCRQSFTAWSDCVDSERKTGGDFTSDCREQTYALRECMLQNRSYYAPVLEEEADFVADKQDTAPDTSDSR